MSTTRDLVAGTASYGVTIGGYFENDGLKAQPSLDGWTAKISLLTLPALTPLVDKFAATLGIEQFDPSTGRVPVSLLLGDLAGVLPEGGVPVSVVRFRAHLFDPDGLEIAGPTPRIEQLHYRFNA